MSDNTTISPGTGGDSIRDLDRGTGAKTQVVQIDMGGPSSNPESLLSAANPLPITDAGRSLTVDTGTVGQPLNVIEANASAAQSSDAPLKVSLVGNETGDFAGIDILEQVVTDGTGLNVNVRVQNPPATGGINGGAVPADGPLYYANGQTAVGSIIIGPIDTTGFLSAAFQISNPSTAGQVIIQGSTDGSSGNWYNLGSLGAGGVGSSTSGILTTGTFLGHVPCIARWMRIQVTTLITGPYPLISLQLRPTPLAWLPGTIAMNAASVSNAPVSATGNGGNGTMPVMGPWKPGQNINTLSQAAEVYPVQTGGIDTPPVYAASGLTSATAPLNAAQITARRLLLDQFGHTKVVGPDPSVAGNSQPVRHKDVDSNAPYESLYEAQLRTNQLLVAIATYLKEMPQMLAMALSQGGNGSTAPSFTDEPYSFSDEPAWFN